MKLKPLHFMSVIFMLPLSLAACGSVAPEEGKANDELSAEGPTAEAQDSVPGKRHPKSCDDVPEGSHVFLPDPSNCARYFECSNGVPVLNECRPPLLWNPKVTTCDYPKNVDCGTAPSP